METRYLPVDSVYYEMIESEKSKNTVAVVHYFQDKGSLGEQKAKIKGLENNKKHEEFLVLDNGTNIRLDRIIVLNGKPGPAYDEYDAYALACLDCTGGMD